MPSPVALLELDHLVIVAPSLDAGVDHVRICLGLEMPYGGAHPEMGTHNHLLRLGDDIFLEVIAVDRQAGPTAGPRWFGLDDREAVEAAWNHGRRLRGWVTRTDHLDPVLARHGELLGRRKRVSRGDRAWDFAVRDDGRLPADGAAPCVIAWGDRGCPASAMPDLGARLRQFAIQHPDPNEIDVLYASLRIERPPEVRPGPRVRLEAVIDTPTGSRTLF